MSRFRSLNQACRTETSARDELTKSPHVYRRRLQRKLEAVPQPAGQTYSPRPFSCRTGLWPQRLLAEVRESPRRVPAALPQDLIPFDFEQQAAAALERPENPADSRDISLAALLLDSAESDRNQLSGAAFPRPATLVIRISNGKNTEQNRQHTAAT